ncbi:unnamed protein product, partial [Polarella glacialis]
CAAAPLPEEKPRQPRILAALLLICLIRRLVEIAVGIYGVRPTTSFARAAMLPMRAVGTAEYAAVMSSPALCAATLVIWNRLNLPGQDRAVGQNIARLLRISIWG